MVVLIVEDEAIIAVNLALVLEAAGHQVVGPARTSVEAMELARTCRPELALVDINLEGRPDGVDLARTLQRQGIPSVFLSAQHGQAFAHRDAALGFLEKPYTAANVCESLKIISAMLHGQELPVCTGGLEVFSAPAANSPEADNEYRTR